MAIVCCSLFSVGLSLDWCSHRRPHYIFPLCRVKMNLSIGKSLKYIYWLSHARSFFLKRGCSRLFSSWEDYNQIPIVIFVNGWRHKILKSIFQRELYASIQVDNCCKWRHWLPFKMHDRLAFWSDCGAQYKVDLSVLRPYAHQCMTKNVHIGCVDPTCVLAKPTQICHLDLNTTSVQEIQQVEVCSASVFNDNLYEHAFTLNKSELAHLCDLSCF